MAEVEWSGVPVAKTVRIGDGVLPHGNKERCEKLRCVLPTAAERGRCEMDDGRPRMLERGAAFSLLHKSSPYLNLYPSVGDKPQHRQPPPNLAATALSYQRTPRDIYLGEFKKARADRNAQREINRKPPDYFVQHVDRNSLILAGCPLVWHSRQSSRYCCPQRRVTPFSCSRLETLPSTGMQIENAGLYSRWRTRERGGEARRPLQYVARSDCGQPWGIWTAHIRMDA